MRNGRSAQASMPLLVTTADRREPSAALRSRRSENRQNPTEEQQTANSNPASRPRTA